MRLAWLFAALTAATLVARPSAAQSVRGDGQLALAVPVLGYTSTTVKTEDTSGVVSVSSERDVSNIVWGIRAAPTLELGYGISDMVVLGALLELGGESTSIDGSDVDISTFELFVAPKVDLMFASGSKLQPFVGAAVGVVHVATTVGDNDSSGTGVGLLARAGLRYFASKGLSIDPYLALFYSSATSAEDIGVGTINVGTVDTTATSLQIALFFAVSGWL